jgi:hypothetical protein
VPSLLGHQRIANSREAVATKTPARAEMPSRATPHFYTSNFCFRRTFKAAVSI